MKPTKKNYDDSYSRPNKIMKPQRWEKANILILAVSDINYGSTYPSMAASEENKLPPSFSDFNLTTFSMNPAMMGSREQKMMNSR